MAIMRQGPLGTVSGNLGGICIAVGKSGSIVRARKVQVAPSSPQHLSRQAFIARVAKFWHEPVMAQYRQAWIRFALAHPVPDRFGAKRIRSAFNWNMSGIPLMEFFGWLFWQPPYTCTTDSISFATADVLSDGTWLATAQGIYDPYYTVAFWQISRWANRIAKNCRPTWVSLPGYFPVADTTDLSAEIAAAGIQPVEGEEFFLRVRFWTSGRLPTAWFPTTAICIAP